MSPIFVPFSFIILQKITSSWTSVSRQNLNNFIGTCATYIHYILFIKRSVNFLKCFLFAVGLIVQETVQGAMDKSQSLSRPSWSLEQSKPSAPWWKLGDSGTGLGVLLGSNGFGGNGWVSSLKTSCSFLELLRCSGQLRRGRACKVYGLFKCLARLLSVMR